MLTVESGSRRRPRQRSATPGSPFAPQRKPPNPSDWKAAVKPAVGFRSRNAADSGDCSAVHLARFTGSAVGGWRGRCHRSSKLHVSPMEMKAMLSKKAFAALAVSTLMTAAVAAPALAEDIPDLQKENIEGARAGRRSRRVEGQGPVRRRSGESQHRRRGTGRRRGRLDGGLHRRPVDLRSGERGSPVTRCGKLRSHERGLPHAPIDKRCAATKRPVDCPPWHSPPRAGA